MRTSINILVLLTTAIFFAGCDKKEQLQTENQASTGQQNIIKLTSRSVKEIGLQTETVKTNIFTREISIPAKILADQDNEALVGTLVQGRVCKVFVKVGDYVKNGQDLMLVEGLEIGEIKEQYLTARANLNYQKANFERQKRLFNENIGSHKAFLEAKNEYEKSLAQFTADENRIKAIHLNENNVFNEETTTVQNKQNFCTLPVKSPIEGVIVERNVVIGQSIDVSANAFKIINLKSVWADGQMYEKDLDKINDNSQVAFSTPAFSREIFSGKICYVGQTIDEKTRTITVRAEFNNADKKLKPQMFGELKIPVSETKALVISVEALAKIDNTDYVFVKRDDETFEKTKVTVGATENEYAEIKAGLKEGDVIVVKGSSYLKAELLKALLGEEE